MGLFKPGPEGQGGLMGYMAVMAWAGGWNVIHFDEQRTVASLPTESQARAVVDALEGSATQPIVKAARDAKPALMAALKRAELQTCELVKIANLVEAIQDGEKA